MEPMKLPDGFSLTGEGLDRRTTSHSTFCLESPWDSLTYPESTVSRFGEKKLLYDQILSVGNSLTGRKGWDMAVVP